MCQHQRPRAHRRGKLARHPAGAVLRNAGLLLGSMRLEVVRRAFVSKTERHTGTDFGWFASEGTNTDETKSRAARACATQTVVCECTECRLRGCGRVEIWRDGDNGTAAARAAARNVCRLVPHAHRNVSPHPGSTHMDGPRLLCPPPFTWYPPPCPMRRWPRAPGRPPPPPGGPWAGRTPCRLAPQPWWVGGVVGGVARAIV